MAKNSRVVVGRNAVNCSAFLLANPRHLLCRLDIPGIGVVEESDAVVAVNRINQDVRLPFRVCKVTRLGEYHRIPRLPVGTRFRRHDECLGSVIGRSHPELHLLEPLQLAFGVLGDEVGGQNVIHKLAQPVGIGQVRSYGVAAVTVVAPFLDRTSASGRGAHSAFEIGHTVIGNLRNKHTFAEYALFHFKDAILVDAPSGNTSDELAELDPISEGYGEGSAVSLVFSKEHSQGTQSRKHVIIRGRCRVIPSYHIHATTTAARIGLSLQSKALNLLLQLPNTGIGSGFPDSIYRGIIRQVKIEFKSDNP